MIADAIASRKPNMGQIFFVATTAVAGWDEFSSMFPTGPEGNTRVWTTLKGLLNGSVVTNNGDDVVYVLPNHTESIDAAAALNFASVNGLTVIGLGEADERPLFTWITATGADMEIDSNGVTLENLRLDMTGVDALTGPIDVDSSGFTLRDCEIIHATGTNQAVNCIVGDANADRFKMERCWVHGTDTAGTVSAIRLNGSDHFHIKDCYFDGAYKITAGAIQATTAAVGYGLVENCVIINKTASSVATMSFFRGSTLTVVGCTLSVLSGTTPILIDESTGLGGTGRITTGRNYYRAATTVSAGTLL